MGFVLSILYLLTCYLTPPVLFGPLAEFRIELILAAILTFISIPILARSILPRTPQTLAVIGLGLATFLSVAIGAHWMGGGINAILAFIPNPYAYFLICLHCNSKKKMQTVIFLLLFVCLFVIGQGALEMHRGLPTGDAATNMNFDQSYFFGMSNEFGQWFYRLRGMGQIHDPNDFAQLIVCVLPLTFFFWKKKSAVRNFFLVLVPVGILLWGAYLTHSRGSILALMAILIVAVRKRIGTIPALFLAGLLFAGASAMNYAGGRDISTSAGEDRTELWGDGLQLLKSHPLFGIGFGQMPDAIGKTAHNTIVVCAAEMGLMGLFFWSLFLFPSLRDSVVVAYPKKSPPNNKGSPREPVFTRGPVMDDAYPLAPPGLEVPDAEEIRRFGRLLVLSFTGFLVSGWFLSRAYVMTLFLLGGLAEVTCQMALQRGLISSRLPFGRVLRYSGMMTIGFILMMYVILRIVNLTH